LTLPIPCYESFRISSSRQLIPEKEIPLIHFYFDLSACVPYSRVHGSQQGLYPVHSALARVKTVIQPSGSIKDEEVIAAANEHGIAVIFTGMRHFRH